jgi:hypothetical protein
MQAFLTFEVLLEGLVGFVGNAEVQGTLWIREHSKHHMLILEQQQRFQYWQTEAFSRFGQHGFLFQ